MGEKDGLDQASTTSLRPFETETTAPRVPCVGTPLGGEGPIAGFHGLIWQDELLEELEVVVDNDGLDYWARWGRGVGSTCDGSHGHGGKEIC